MTSFTLKFAVILRGVVFLAISASSGLRHHRRVAFWISLPRRDLLEICAFGQFPYKAKLWAQLGLAIPLVFSLQCKKIVLPSDKPLYQCQARNKKTELLFLHLLNASWLRHLKKPPQPPKNNPLRECVMFVPWALPTNNSLQTLQHLSLHHMFIQCLTRQSSATHLWSLDSTVM